MKVLSLLLPVALAGTATARDTWFNAGAGFSISNKDQVAITDALKVPGQNPLYYCAAADDYIIDIESVDLTPNPPEA